MDAELKRKWVEALRSGKYQQTSGFLCRPESEDDPGYCCLGVLLDINGAEWVPGKGVALDAVLDGVVLSSAALASDFWQFDLGMTTDVIDRLINMNDGEEGYARHTFSKIADYIEANL